MARFRCSSVLQAGIAVPHSCHLPQEATVSDLQLYSLGTVKRDKGSYGTVEGPHAGQGRIFSCATPGPFGFLVGDELIAGLFLNTLPRQHAGRPGRSLWQRVSLKRRTMVLRLDSSQLPKWVDSPIASLDRLGHEFYSLTEQGHLDRALNVLLLMEQQGSAPSVEMYTCLLKACGKRKALAHAKLVHAHLVGHRSESSSSLDEYVVSVLVKCGGLEDALKVFKKLPHRSVFSWTALISGYTACGKGKEALKMYQAMQEDGLQPNSYTFVSLLKACGTMGDLEEGRRIHADILRHRCDLDLFVCTSLVEMYGRCGSIADAQSVFHMLTYRDAVAWNALLVAHILHGQTTEALHLYEQMQEEGVGLDARTAVSIIQVCGMLAQQAEECIVNGTCIKVQSLEQGKAIHAEVRLKGYESNPVVGSTLISMYGKCGSIADAKNVFDGLPLRDVVAWNAMLSAYVVQGQADFALQLYQKMWDAGVGSSNQTLVSVLQACGMLAEKEEAILLHGQPIKAKAWVQGKVVHAHAHRKGYDSDAYVGSTLLSMYQKCGDIAGAQNVFDGLTQLNVVSCNSMLTSLVEHGWGKEALQLYEQMCEGGEKPDHRTFVSILKACGMLAKREEDVSMHGQCIKATLLFRGKAIHADFRRKDYDSDVFVGNALISMYGRCGSIVDAQNVFDGLPQRDVVSCNGLLVAYLQQAQGEKALQLYEQMQEKGLSPNDRTFVSALQACGILALKEEAIILDGRFIKVLTVEKLKLIHAGAQRKGYDSDAFVASTLVSMFGKCGSLENAEKVFDELPLRDVVTWNAMLAVYVDLHQAEEALQLHEQMLEEGISYDDRTIVSTVQACGMVAEKQTAVLVDGQRIKPSSWDKGKAIHSELQRKGLGSDVFVASALISMYGKSGSIPDAEGVFEGLHERDMVLWNAMLFTYVEQGQSQNALQLYEEMCDTGVSPGAQTFLGMLQVICRLAEKEEDVVVDGHSTKLTCVQRGQAIHADIIRRGLCSDLCVSSALISMYSKCGSICDAHNVFDRLSQSDVVAQTAMLAAYVDNRQVAKALEQYEQMWEQDFTPNNRTFVSMLTGCSMLAREEENGMVDGLSVKLKSLQIGKSVHAALRQNGYNSDVFIISALVSMYGKCGSIMDAQNVFAESPQRDVVAWTAMLGAYVDHGDAESALQYYELMQGECVSPNEHTVASALQACGMLANKEEDTMDDGQLTRVMALEKGRAIHAMVRSKGLNANSVVASMLISMYGKCRTIVDACDVFHEFPVPDVWLCNAMLVAYIEQGMVEKALQLYRKMQQEGPRPNEITILWVLQAVGKTGNLSMVRQIQHNYVSGGNRLTALINGCLINAYGRCAGIGDAEAVFDALPEPDVRSWNALISSYAHHGDSAAALQCYEKMQSAGVKPNGATFLSLLSACSHAGSVHKGVEYFESMSRDHNINPVIEHYVSMVDLFGRAGCFTQIGDLLAKIPMQPDLAIWLSLLGACRKYGEVALGEQAFHSAICLEPKHAAAYMLMANIYGDAGRSDDANRMMKLREDRGAWKEPGQSWMNHEQTVHKFMVRAQIYGLK